MKFFSELHSRLKYYNLIFNKAPYGICIIDKNANFVQANQEFCTMIGYTREELDKIKFIDITHPDDIEYDRMCMEKFELKQLKEIRIRKRYIHKQGHKVEIFVGVSPIYNSDGKLEHYVCIFQDVDKDKMIFDNITESEAHTRKLEALNAELEQFSYVASHDLKSPLRSISTFVNLLEDKISSFCCSEKDEQGKIPQYIENIKKSINQAEVLVTDLLELSRMQKESNNKESIQLNEFIQDIVDINLKHRISETKAKIQISGDTTFYTSPVHVAQVFQNLIENSLKYSRSDVPPEISIKIEEYPSKVYVELTDNGIGIDKQYHKQIFQPFKRLHGHDKYEGSGIGLFTCKKILERHNGEIKIKHSTENVGTTFSLTWGE